MTNIAIKNGAVIVKDGKVAEDCACCGGWYCYPNLCSTNFDGTPTLWACDQDAAESVAIQVTYSGNKWCHWLRSPTNPNMAVQYTFEASAEFNEIVALQNMKQVFVYMLTGGINRYAYPCVFKGIVHGHDMIVFPGAYNGSRAKFGDPWEAFIQGAFPVKVIRQDNTVTSVASLESNRTRCTTSTDGSVQPNGTVVVSGLRQTNVMFNFLRALCIPDLLTLNRSARSYW